MPDPQAPARTASAATDVATPAGKPTGLAGLFTLRAPLLFAARLGAALASALGKPLRVGGLVIVARHRDVVEVLARDLDFLIRPINAARFDEIGYHFVLGMDRGGELGVERQALYEALSAVDMAKVRQGAVDDVARRMASVGAGPFDLVEDFARPVAAATASRLFGVAPADQTLFMDVARAIFGHCFLNTGGDRVIAERALAAARTLSAWFDTEIAARRARGEPGEDMMGQLLRAGVADDLVRRTLGGMLVGSIDTTATALAKIMTVLMGEPALLAAASRDTADPRRLYGWCLEALRRWPQTPVLGRRSAKATVLAGVDIPPETSVLLWTQAAMFDGAAFPSPDQSWPDRAPDAYLHLGGGLHPCAGRSVNAWQIPLLVGALLDRRPRALGDLAWAGPFPAHLPIRFEGEGSSTR